MCRRRAFCSLLFFGFHSLCAVPGYISGLGFSIFLLLELLVGIYFKISFFSAFRFFFFFFFFLNLYIK